MSTMPSSSPFAAMMPDTIAAPDDPSPRPCGMTLTARRCTPGIGTPASSNACWIERTTRLLSSVGTSPAPMPSTSTRTPPAVASTVSSS
jgi:hypothetical protein